MFDNTSLDALLVLYICIYGSCFFVLLLICICQNIVCSSHVEEIKNIIIIIIIIETVHLCTLSINQSDLFFELSYCYKIIKNSLCIVFRPLL